MDKGINNTRSSVTGVRWCEKAVNRVRWYGDEREIVVVVVVAVVLVVEQVGQRCSAWGLRGGRNDSPESKGRRLVPTDRSRAILRDGASVIDMTRRALFHCFAPPPWIPQAGALMLSSNERRSWKGR